MIKQKKATFSMTPETLAELDKIAEKTGLNKSAVMRILIKNAEKNEIIKKIIGESED